MGRRRGSAVLALVGLSMTLMAARADAQGDLSTLDDVAQVTLVEVPVLALNADGVSLRGLGREDFELFDDGVLQTLHRVREIDFEKLASPFSESTCPQSARRRVLLLFDSTWTEPAALHDAADSLRNLVLDHPFHPCDLVAVMTFEADAGLRLRLTWSSDRGQLLRALDFRLRETPRSPTGDDPLRFEAAAPGLDLLFAGTGGAAGTQGQKMLEHERALRWMRGLEGIARMLGDSPGTKTVALFTAGFDGRLLAGRPPPPPGPEALESEGGTGRLLAEGGDLRRLQSLDTFGSSELRQALARFATALHRADSRLRLVDLAGLAAAGTEERDGLAHLARATGGDLVAPGNHFAADLARWLEDTKVTYLLTFQPADLEADGRFHLLEVRLRGEPPPGVRLMHRGGYFAPRPFAALHPLEKDLLAAEALLAPQPRREIPFEVLLAPFRGDGQTSYVPLLVKIPAAPETLEIYAYATDGDGRLRDYLHHRETLLSPVDGLKFYGHLELPAGGYRVRVLVRDAVGGRTGVLGVPLLIPDFEAPFLLPPFFPDSSEGWQVAREPTDPQVMEVVYPFTVGGEPFIPAHRPTLTMGEAVECVLVLYGFGNGENLTVGGSLIAADGAVGAVRIERLTRVDRGRYGEKVRLLMIPEGGEAGDYTLRVVAEADGRRAVSQAPIRLLLR